MKKIRKARHRNQKGFNTMVMGNKYIYLSDSRALYNHRVLINDESKKAFEEKDWEYFEKILRDIGIKKEYIYEIKRSVLMEKMVALGNDRVIRDDNKFFIVEVFDFANMYEYEEGTRVLVSSKDRSESVSERFNSQLNSGKMKLFFIRDYTLDESNPEYKVVVQIIMTDMEITMFDANDVSRNVTIDYLTSNYGISEDDLLGNIIPDMHPTTQG